MASSSRIEPEPRQEPSTVLSRHAEPATLAPGAAIVRGHVAVAHLSRGSALDVYDAWSEERQCRCVAKVLRPDRLDDRAARRALTREGRLLLELSHPHIVRAYELLEHPHPVLILETLPGETLAHLIERHRQRLAIRDLAFLGLHLCSALQYLHRHGTLHLDLKPSNIVSVCGQAKLLDLSIAAAPSRGRAGEGTPAYMAPEQARGRQLSAKTDVWGLGLVLFEAASASCPFDRPGATSGYAQLERRAPPLRTLRHLPAAFAEAVDQCLDPQPSARPTLEQLARTLHTTLERAGGGCGPTPPADQRGGRRLNAPRR